MTKKFTPTMLLLAGAAVAMAAAGAAVLMRPDPLAGYGTDLGTPGNPIPNPSGFWDLVPDFGLHNNLVSGSYTSVWDRWVNSIAPPMPLAPRPGGLYGERYSDRYTYDTPAGTGAATTSSGFTPSGNTGTSSGSFGVSAGSLYGRGN
ncbi:hypothetical protein [Deinococcus actinosclerus]|uniref:Uncharacterized protein n=1 Tax=Deinococcus actinosclerus TaxID=1768108 RepID=A0ABM5X647_9DEIO|nr:hypothetical protein [Deinococcus actinosclerus]ALW89181.1 hypothetical protein AUC44_09965 [Deinococcus actinosclerus]